MSLRANEADSAEEKEARPLPLRIWGLIRRLSLMVVVVIVALIVRRYDFESLPEAARPFLSEQAASVTRLVFAKLDRGQAVATGAWVEAEVRVKDAPTSALVLGQIVGQEGQELGFIGRDDGRAELLVDGARTYAALAPSAWELVGIRAGVIPKAHVLLLAARDGRAPDARIYGLVERRALRRKIIAWF